MSTEGKKSRKTPLIVCFILDMKSNEKRHKKANGMNEGVVLFKCVSRRAGT